MAGPDRRGSNRGDGRASNQWTSPPMEVSDDDDEYALAAMGISDGSRPPNMTNNDQNQYSFIQFSESSNPAGQSTQPPRPSSATKPKTFDSFALRHDGAMGHVSGNSSSSSSASNTVPTRPSSTSTASEVYVRREGPYQGPSGPSHPYQMYPQESRIVRTASIATTVLPSERSYAGPTGPTHPYGMYPQATVPESESGQAPQAPPIPVGFPGSNNNYQRRIGPEGEEIAGIIGPDGHTEELPPYTKYPDEAFARKARLTGRAPIAGAGGIGLATRNPEFASQEDLANPTTSRQSVHSVATTSQDNASQSNDLEPGPSEKKQLKKWQKVARKKVCSIIPVWAIILAAIVLVLFAIILGVTLHVFKFKGRKPPYGGQSPNERIVETMTTTFDAAPLTKVPAGLSALPTGTYALPLSVPSAVQSSCLTNTEQSKGWSCIMPQSPLQMQILDLTQATNPLSNKEIILDYGKATMRGFPYGTQPPVLDDPLVLNLVIDQQDPQRGPAWFFQTIYNKVVVVPEDLLSSPYDRKRDVDGRDGNSHHHDELPSTDDFIRRGSAQVGSTPWFCFWNGTLLEAFFYVNQTSSEAAHAAQHATTGSATKSSTTASKTSAFSTPTAASSLVVGADEEYAWGKEHELLSAYPKVLKFQERRIPQGAQAIPPYCTKRVIDDDGTARDMTNTTGSVITIFLNETVPDELQPMKRAYMFGEAPGPAYVRQRQDEDSNCGCVWVAT